MQRSALSSGGRVEALSSVVPSAGRARRLSLALERRWVDCDGMLELRVSASSGVQRSTMRIYLHPEDLDEFGADLRRFPASTAHAVVLEAGSREPNGHGYFRLRVYCSRGAVGVTEVTRIARDPAPDGFESRFEPAEEPAALHRLGRGIQAFVRDGLARLDHPAEASDGGTAQHAS